MQKKQNRNKKWYHSKQTEQFNYMLNLVSNKHTAVAIKVRKFLYRCTGVPHTLFSRHPISTTCFQHVSVSPVMLNRTFARYSAISEFYFKETSYFRNVILTKVQAYSYKFFSVLGESTQIRNFSSCMTSSQGSSHETASKKETNNASSLNSQWRMKEGWVG